MPVIGLAILSNPSGATGVAERACIAATRVRLNHTDHAVRTERIADHVEISWFEDI